MKLKNIARAMLLLLCLSIPTLATDVTLSSFQGGSCYNCGQVNARAMLQTSASAAKSLIYFRRSDPTWKLYHNFTLARGAARNYLAHPSFSVSTKAISDGTVRGVASKILRLITLARPLRNASFVVVIQSQTGLGVSLAWRVTRLATEPWGNSLTRRVYVPVAVNVRLFVRSAVASPAWKLDANVKSGSASLDGLRVFAYNAAFILSLQMGASVLLVGKSYAEVITSYVTLFLTLTVGSVRVAGSLILTFLLLITLTTMGKRRGANGVRVVSMDAFARWASRQSTNFFVTTAIWLKITTARVRILGLILLLLVAPICASATDVQLSSFQIKDWNWGGAHLKLRLYSSDTWTDSLGFVRGAGTAGSQAGFFNEIICPISGTTATCPSSVIPSTIDSIDKPRVRITGALFTDKNVFKQNLFTSWAIPAITPTTWLNLVAYNPPNAKPQPFGDNYYNVAAVDAKILAATGGGGTAPLATDAIFGKLKVTVPPAVVGEPVAVGANDGRVPTQSENDALAGTSGTPSSANKYLTALDPTVIDGKSYATFAAAVTAIGATETTLRVSSALTVTGNLTVPANCSLQFIGVGKLTVSTGVTLTIVAPVSAEPRQIFANATAGLGTVSFSGNVALTQVSAAWWGALPSASATVNAAALNAANTALLTNTASGVAAGKINLGPGVYEFNALVTLGTAVTFTSISLNGTGNLVGTQLRWTGSTSGTAVLWSLQRGSTISNVTIANGVAKGTTIGLRLSGPNTGTQTSGVTLNNVTVSAFHISGLAGDGVGGGHDASEITLIACRFAGSDVGFQTDGFNTLNIFFYGCQFGSNTIGLNIGAVAATHVYGGTWGQNDIGISFNSAGTLFVSGVRDETNAPGGQFIVSTAGSINAAITVIGCSFPVDTGEPMMEGAGAFMLIGNQFGSTGAAVKTYLGDSSSGNGASLTMIGNMVHDGGNLFETAAGSVGMTYNVSGNTKQFSGGGRGKWDDEEGIIDASGDRIVTNKLSGLSTARFQDLFRLRLMSVAEGSALTVSSNTITPTSSLHQVGAGLIKTITVPSGFTSGTIQLVPTVAFTYDATGNILGTGTAVVGRTMGATLSASTGKWSMSY